MGDIKDNPKKVKILIVGAGIAGLSAARHLKDNDETDFLILEARNRVGGRVLSLPLGDSIIELGANWLHGILGNPLFDYASKKNVLDFNSSKHSPGIIAATEDGVTIPVDVIKEVYEAYLSYFKRCEQLFQSSFALQSESVGEQLDKYIHAYLSSDLKNRVSSDTLKAKKLIFNNFLMRETSISGCHSMNDVSLKDIGSYEELLGGNLLVPSGFQRIIESLQDDIPQDSVLLRHPVTRIVWKSDNSKEASSALVLCDNREAFLADHVVIAVPLGCLKTSSIIFEPPLPNCKLDAINKIGFGTVDKIFLHYEKPFLSKDIDEILLLWDDDPDMDNVSEKWYKKLFSFTKVSPTILMSWVSGLQAAHMEKLLDSEISDRCTEVLSKFLVDQFVPKPIRVVRTTWHDQIYTQGSYSYIAVGSSQKDIEVLAEPLYQSQSQSKPTVLFAGEATHPKFYSTTHGAFLSGIKAANLLLKK